MTLGKLSAEHRETELESGDMGGLILPPNYLSICWLCSLVLDMVEDSIHITSHLQMPSQHNAHRKCVSFAEISGLLSFKSQYDNCFLCLALLFCFFLYPEFVLMSNTNAIILKNEIMKLGLSQWGKLYIGSCPR